MLRAVVAEGIGTFILMLAGTGAVVTDGLSGGRLGILGIALTFGLVVMALIYAMGHISGAHFNPAVTIAFAVVRHFPRRLILPYWIAQVSGALLGSLAVQTLIGSANHLGATHSVQAPLQTIALEAILTFFLMFVIMAVATDSRAVGEAAAIAIGGTITLEALFAGPITGASMNPARSFAPALLTGDLSDLWAYIVGPTFGAVAGALFYRWVGAHPLKKGPFPLV